MHIADKHCRDCGAAVNVKSHGLRLVDGGTDAQRERAWNAAAESWWRDAAILAQSHGYSGAGACGRSGGWCVPYDGDSFRGAEADAKAPRFLAFAAAVDAQRRAMPERFAEELAHAIAQDREEETNAQKAEAHDKARGELWRVEVTDTYGGEANYSWCRRYTFRAPAGTKQRGIMQRAKACAGYTGVRGDVASFGDSYEYRPRGECVVMFVTWSEESAADGDA